MVPAIKKNFAELETGLVHLQQNIDIPEINLIIHPLITAAVKKAEKEKSKAKAQDFDVEDSTFLNALQAGVNRWIREVQKVTQLDRDPSSGTAIQEVSFWLNLERALRNIREKCESTEVSLTLEVLRLGRRFHVTVKFDTDTGLKSALETVNDYQNLMKDFPLNDLLSATDLLNIKIALVSIFTHLKNWCLSPLRGLRFRALRARVVRVTASPTKLVSFKLINPLSRRVLTVAFVKRGPHLENTKRLTRQIQAIQLPQDSTYESLHAVLSAAIIPIFNSFVTKSGKLDEGDKMVPAIKKNFAELETGLVHLQQNIDIPEINLIIHPLITAAVKKAEKEKSKAKAQDFDVEDSTFLNALQAGVNRWIREVQKVTQLDRDPSSGTAIQEVSFWLNLERALRNIREKCESTEVSLTLEVLRLGRRFHVTVKFDTDTGLKSALETVNDYQNLMKDFPLNDLLSATDLLNIKIALVSIFTHLKKAGSSPIFLEGCSGRNRTIAR
eukprot:sb/3464088/